MQQGREALGKAIPRGDIHVESWRMGWMGMQDHLGQSRWQKSLRGHIPVYYFFKDFIYRDRERGAERHRQREKQAPCREPDVGLDPRSPGSGPGLKAALNHCATGAAQINKILKKKDGMFQKMCFSLPASLICISDTTTLPFLPPRLNVKSSLPLPF